MFEGLLWLRTAQSQTFLHTCTLSWKQHSIGSSSTWPNLWKLFERWTWNKPRRILYLCSHKRNAYMVEAEQLSSVCGQKWQVTWWQGQYVARKNILVPQAVQPLQLFWTKPVEMFVKQKVKTKDNTTCYKLSSKPANFTSSTLLQNQRY